MSQNLSSAEVVIDALRQPADNTRKRVEKEEKKERYSFDELFII